MLNASASGWSTSGVRETVVASDPASWLLADYTQAYFKPKRRSSTTSATTTTTTTMMDKLASALELDTPVCERVFALYERSPLNRLAASVSAELANKMSGDELYHAHYRQVTHHNSASSSSPFFILNNNVIMFRFACSSS